MILSMVAQLQQMQFMLNLIAFLSMKLQQDMPKANSTSQNDITSLPYPIFPFNRNQKVKSDMEKLLK
jgi:hypothetical protein